MPQCRLPNELNLIGWAFEDLGDRQLVFAVELNDNYFASASPGQPLSERDPRIPGLE